MCGVWVYEVQEIPSLSSVAVDQLNDVLARLTKLKINK